MLRLPPLRVLYPTSWDEAVGLLAQYPQALLLAGGSDLLPALKTGQVSGELLVSLARVRDRLGVEVGEAHLRLGAGLSLAELAACPHIPAALAQAAAQVASPQIRERATLGGNLCLDTRCRYVNGSPLYRQALGGCLKSHGQECHVVSGGTRCVAALCADTAPVLTALEARLELLGPAGERTMPLVELYRSDGRQHLNLLPGELLRSLVFAPLPPTSRLVYRKWRPRQSLDFPLVSLALRVDLGPAGLSGGALVVGALGPKPRVLSLAALAGCAPGPDLVESLVELAGRCRPLANLPYEVDYRRERLLVEVRRAAREVLC